MSENFRLLFSLYWRPRRTMGRILDEGSLLFGAAAVLVVSLLLVLASKTRSPEAVRQAECARSWLRPFSDRC